MGDNCSRSFQLLQPFPTVESRGSCGLAGSSQPFPGSVLRTAETHVPEAIAAVSTPVPFPDQNGMEGPRGCGVLVRNSPEHNGSGQLTWGREAAAKDEKGQVLGWEVLEGRASWGLQALQRLFSSEDTWEGQCVSSLRGSSTF